MENLKVLRKLGNTEKSILFRQVSEVFNMSFHLKSKIDLYRDENVLVLKDSIRKWQMTHPFLNAFIRKNEQDNEYYFVTRQESDQSSLHNVKFLLLNEGYLSENGHNSFSRISDLIAEKFHYESFDSFSENGPLWNLTFLGSKSDQKNKTDFDFDAVLLFHHSIADGVSAYENFIKLLAIIEDSFKNQCSRELLKHVELLAAPQELYSNIKSACPDHLPKIFKAKFVDPLNSMNSTDYSFLEKFANEYLLEFDEKNSTKKWMKIGDLVSILKNNPSKYKRFQFNEAKTRLLLKLCKENQTKLSSVFVTVLSLALKSMYNRNNEALENILYNTAVSLRQFKTGTTSEYLIPYDALGYYVGSTLTLFSQEIDFDINCDLSQSKFWEMCRKENENLHRDVQSKNKFLIVPKQETEDQIAFQFGLSNLGLVKSSLRDENPLIKITENSFASNYTGHFRKEYFYNFITTVNDRLNWTISFNSFLVDPIIIEEVIADCKLIIDKITD
jgi:hypothetical protein